MAGMRSSVGLCWCTAQGFCRLCWATLLSLSAMFVRPYDAAAGFTVRTATTISSNEGQPIAGLLLCICKAC